MRVKLWGTQGSLPSPIDEAQVRRKLRDALLSTTGVDLSNPDAVDAYIDSLPFHVRGTYGGNTPCVEIRNSRDDLLIIDAGSGIRALGGELLKREFGKGLGTAHLLMSHFHWDHMQGFPFFTPAYIKGNHITLWGSARGGLREAFERQQSSPFFPVGLDIMESTLEFRDLLDVLEPYNGRFRVLAHQLDHPGGCHSFRIEADGKSFVYASDGEYKRGDAKSLQPYLDFFCDADVLLFDAQFSVVESLFEKRDWGHSAAPMGVEIACAAGVKKLVLFHHDPRSEDAFITKILEDAIAYAEHIPHKGRVEILAAHDGMELDLE